MRDPLARLLVAVCLLIALLLGVLAPGRAQTPTPDVTGLIDADTLMAHVRALAVDIGARPAGSAAETDAAAYIAGQFGAWGYDVRVQAFDVPGGGTSRNVIASRPGEGRMIIVGAHLDSVTAGTGAGDNASGVAAVLAAAEALAGVDTVRPVTFIAFGAEEIGLCGSSYYVDHLTGEQIADILVMINVDMVGIGDHLYVYAGAITGSQTCNAVENPGPTWARNLALDLGAALGYDVRTSPPGRWDGFTGLWSDHAAFAAQGVPVVYFERWNWDAGSDPCWGQETADAGDFLHSPRDTFEHVDPAKLEPAAETLTALVIALATDPDLPDALIIP
ncbi:MAG: M20/M25/M40 family metallo-hydrolase [Anaerolineae bacterium]|nr:M20/M25/M40 family metallo-hydrolase [Anaerolineae bacterium]